MRVRNNYGSDDLADGPGPGDACSAHGAKVLKRRIEAYWAARGKHVTIKLVEAGFVSVMRSARTDVRSDMINGLPIEKKHVLVR